MPTTSSREMQRVGNQAVNVVTASGAPRQEADVWPSIEGSRPPTSPGLTGGARFEVALPIRGYMLRLEGGPREDAKTRKLREAAVAALGGEAVIQFKGGRATDPPIKARYDTRVPEVIAFLRHGISTGKLKRVTEDIAMIDLVSPYTGEIVKGADMAAHVAEHQLMGTAPVDDEDEEADEPEDGYAALTMVELKDLAEERGVKVPSGARKADVIAALEAADDDDEDAE